MFQRLGKKLQKKTTQMQEQVYEATIYTEFENPGSAVKTKLFK